MYIEQLELKVGCEKRRQHCVGGSSSEALHRAVRFEFPHNASLEAAGHKAFESDSSCKGIWCSILKCSF
jgi:hypothetical protein